MKTNSKILIVEDKPELLQATTRLLQRNGYEVFGADTGGKCLQLVREIMPDLVLLDVMLPDTNGFLVCEQIKSDPHTADVYVMFLSGNKIDAANQSKGLELGAEGYLVRPASNREILARVEALLRIKNTEKALRLANQEQARLNEALTRSNQDLQQFAYAISHDLKEPLRMVTSFLKLLERRYAADLDENAKEYIAFAVDGADRMKIMIEGLLEFSRVSTQKDAYKLVSGPAILEKVLRNLQVVIAEAGAQVEVLPLPTFFADESQIGQVFQNLIANGLKYHEDDIPQIEISARDEDAQWVFLVKDNGIGINPKNQERIFGIFQRLHTRDEYAGAGMGLAICKRIVERHGGQIWVESQPGDGSTFAFSIPKNSGPELSKGI